MKVYRYLEKPTKILSLHVNEIFFVALFIVCLVSIVGIAGKFIYLPAKLNLVVFLLGIFLFIILKKANKQNHPSFIISYLSYYFLLPSKIKIGKGSKLPVKKKHHV